MILHRLAVAALLRGEREKAASLGKESLELHRASGSAKGEAQALGFLGQLAWEDGRRERALALLAKSAEIARSAGFRWWEGSMLSQFAWHSLELGRPDDAARAARDALAIKNEIGDRAGACYAVALVAGAAAVAEHWTTAGRLWGAVEAERERKERTIPWADEGDGFFAGIILDRAGEVLQDARTAGHSLPFETAVEEALAAG